jgi:hypothetical protein
MNMKKTPLVLLLTLLALGLAWAQDDYDEVANMSFVVVKDYNGKPIRNAAVVLHPVNKEGRQEKGGLELKTDEYGKAGYDGIPYGELRVQALAPGFQTYGEDFEISKPTVAITIRMKRPQHQYSIYTDQQNDKKPNSSQKKDEPQK